MPDRPNVIIVFGDQWRAQAAGYAGDPNVQTPNLDRFAAESVRFTTAVSNCPVCSPWRASLLTGRYPLTHGVFLNDVPLRHDCPSIADAFKAGGYDTAYIGKWHVDGQGRLSFTPPERRQGFDFWRAMECTHLYNESAYYADTPERLRWPGYDAFPQTRCAIDYIRSRSSPASSSSSASSSTSPANRPFLLTLSWGPPHGPYQTAPEQFRAMYEPAALQLRPNVPPEVEAKAREDLAGYYAHCTALDVCLGELLAALDECGVAENTIVLFTSDHGAMLGSQGHRKKQKPWAESALVPCLLRWPSGLEGAREVPAPFVAPDIMPTLLSLCGLPVPDTVEGLDFAPHLRDEAPAPTDTALIANYHVFGEWGADKGGREYRGVRTERFTFVRDASGPWLLYDSAADPYQLENLVDRPDYAGTQADLDCHLSRILDEQGDEFRPGLEYVEQWGYEVNETGNAPW
jgi:arylsulfatase A-like enzyme